MRFSLSPALALAALALAALALSALALAATDPDAGAQHCSALQRQAVAMSPRAVSVALVWETAPARAAAALLRAALVAATYRNVTLVRVAASARLCWLLEARLPPATVVVAPAAAWAPSDRCRLGARALRPQGAGAAPAAPRLHERLAPRWRDVALCTAPRDWTFYEDAAALRDCGFLPPGNDTAENAIVYVLEDEWKNETDELRKEVRHTRLRLVTVRREDLYRLAAYDDVTSFLFVDADLWPDVGGVRLAASPPRALRDRSVTLTVATEYTLRAHAPALDLLLATFAPSVRDLHRVLRRARDLGFEEAACECGAGPDPPRGFTAWRAAAARPVARAALAILCDADGHVYDRAIDILNRTFPVDLRIRTVEVDCRNPWRSIRDLLDRDCYGELMFTVGAAAPAAIARAAAPYAAKLQLPLVAYEAAAASESPALRSAAGRPERLAPAVRWLLAACGWRRAGVVSDGSPEAAELAAALRAPPALVLREVNVTSPADAAAAVEALLAADARVFLVNADAATAARALAAALALRLTPEAGYVWIVLDYDAPDDATAALRPYSVSFHWRGEATSEAGAIPGSGETLRSQLDELWKGRAWPRYAATMMNALLTLRKGFERLVTDHPEMRDYPRNDIKLRYFWDSFRNRNVSGVNDQLTYDERGVAAPRVYVSRWGADPRPGHVASWRVGRGAPRGACPAGARPPGDGAARCVVRAGDDFDPRCRDVAWIVAGVATALLAAAVALAVRMGRRALARRDRRFQLEVLARLLAQRERAFAALAPHVVDRAAVELHRELGAGRFGRVHLGVLRAEGARPLAVAAKELRERAAPDDESRFLREACTLAALEHDHIVRFVGVCVSGGPPLLLMEHAFFGDLLRYLRARRHLAEGGARPEDEAPVGPEEAAYVSAEALTRLAYEAASALAHLARRGIVHRDVRAANCLVDGRRSLKLADFGLARETGEAVGEYACRGRALFPVLRMAPESLARGVASAASDVWSFGVLVLEVVTLGARPYGSASPQSVVRSVLAGGRPPLPRDAGAETRALVSACWRREPGARPTAARLAGWLTERRRALRPALAPDFEEMDCDSGYDEPRTYYFVPDDAHVPYADAPDPDAPYANAPDAEAPYVNAPDAPYANAPDADAPYVNAPDAYAPYVNAPDAPYANAPDADAPYVNAPDADAPYVNAPDAPYANAPDAPYANAPDAAAPFEPC